MELFYWLTISNFLYIVILLILAGISILALIHSGLIKKGSKAKEEYENSQYKENMILSEY